MWESSRQQTVLSCGYALVVLNMQVACEIMEDKDRGGHVVRNHYGQTNGNSGFNKNTFAVFFSILGCV